MKTAVFVTCGGLVLQRDEEFQFDAAMVQRMEGLVLDALDWRTRSVTPLAFLGFYLSACYPPLPHPPQVAAVKARAVDLLLRVQPGTFHARTPYQCRTKTHDTVRALLNRCLLQR